MKHFLDVTEMTTVEIYLGSLDESTLVVYSPTSLAHLGHLYRKNIFVSTHEISKDTAKIEEFCKKRPLGTVIGLGGGTAIDIAKYIAYLTDSRFICMPTMLSTNTFATNKVALIKNGPKITLDAKLADEIILDPTLVRLAGLHNLYGLCDILSIHTALCDWRLAGAAGVEVIDPEVYERSEKLLNDAVRFALELSDGNELDIPTLFSMIGESGYITNLYGSGRPESGSEHIFAKELERIVAIPHGISIAVGITLMSQLQGNHSARIQAALKQIGVMGDIVNKYELRTAIAEALEGVLPRKDRYTILDEKLPSTNSITHLAEALYAEILGHENEYSHR